LKSGGERRGQLLNVLDVRGPGDYGNMREGQGTHAKIISRKGAKELRANFTQRREGATGQFHAKAQRRYGPISRKGAKALRELRNRLRFLCAFAPLREIRLRREISVDARASAPLARWQSSARPA
jgi:hypothetical protein